MFKISTFIESVVIDRVTMLLDLTVSPPIPKCVCGYAEIFRGFGNSKVSIQFGHTSDPAIASDKS